MIARFRNEATGKVREIERPWGAEIGEVVTDHMRREYVCFEILPPRPLQKLWDEPSSKRDIVSDYRVIDGALPPRKLRYVDPQGRVRTEGIDPASGVDTNPLTKLYPRVNKNGKPVFLSKRERDNVMRSDAAKQAGFIDVR